MECTEQCVICATILYHIVLQEPSDDAVREELIRKHFATRIAELSGQVGWNVYVSLLVVS